MIQMKTITFFEGANWWVNEIFTYKGESFVHLMRETPGLIANYGRVGERGLLPIHFDEKQQVAEAYKNILALRITQEGEKAIPRIGDVWGSLS